MGVNSFKGFTGVFQRRGSPTSRVGAENAVGSACASRTRCLNALGAQVLWVGE
mgnify:CR=1 FL=1